MRSNRQPVATEATVSRWFKPFCASGGPKVCHCLRPLCSITVPSPIGPKRAVWRCTRTQERGWPVP